MIFTDADVDVDWVLNSSTALSSLRVVSSWLSKCYALHIHLHKLQVSEILKHIAVPQIPLDGFRRILSSADQKTGTPLADDDWSVDSEAHNGRRNDGRGPS
jgi:hypothetical protein